MKGGTSRLGLPLFQQGRQTKHPRCHHQPEDAFEAEGECPAVARRARSRASTKGVRRWLWRRLQHPGFTSKPSVRLASALLHLLLGKGEPGPTADLGVLVGTVVSNTLELCGEEATPVVTGPRCCDNGVRGPGVSFHRDLTNGGMKPVKQTWRGPGP
eukprot:6468499-Amphidinium_carterae.8